MATYPVIEPTSIDIPHDERDRVDVTEIDKVESYRRGVAYGVLTGVWLTYDGVSKKTNLLLKKSKPYTEPDVILIEMFDQADDKWGYDVNLGTLRRTLQEEFPDVTVTPYFIVTEPGGSRTLELEVNDTHELRIDRDMCRFDGLEVGNSICYFFFQCAEKKL